MFSLQENKSNWLFGWGHLSPHKYLLLVGAMICCSNGISNPTPWRRVCSIDCHHGIFKLYSFWLAMLQMHNKSFCGVMSSCYSVEAFLKHLYLTIWHALNGGVNIVLWNWSCKRVGGQTPIFYIFKLMWSLLLVGKVLN